MAHKWAGWTTSSIGRENAPDGSDEHCIGNEIGLDSFTLGRETWDEAGNYSQDAKVARQDVPYEFDFHQHADVPHAWGRVDVPNPIPSGLEVPAPFAGDPGQTPLDFNSVGDRASDRDHGEQAPDGRSAPPASTGVLGDRILD